MSAAALIALPGTGSEAPIRRFRTTVRIRAEASGGVASVMEHTLAPGCLAMPVHRHPTVAEVLHVLAGTLTVTLDSRVHVAPAGTSLVIPPGAAHTFWVALDASEPARVLAVVTPGGMERYYEAVAAAVPAPATGRGPHMPGVLAAGEAHGVEVDMESLYPLIEAHGLTLA
jgi:quercetin dioxygenase-like cupin family protein